MWIHLLINQNCLPNKIKVCSLDTCSINLVFKVYREAFGLKSLTNAKNGWRIIFAQPNIHKNISLVEIKENFKSVFVSEKKLEFRPMLLFFNYLRIFAGEATSRVGTWNMASLNDFFTNNPLNSIKSIYLLKVDHWVYLANWNAPFQ